MNPTTGVLIYLGIALATAVCAFVYAKYGVK